jgi:hypothetical protein
VKRDASYLHSAAILDEFGDVVAVGRIRERKSALKVWARRNEQTPWYVAGGGMNSPPSV